MTDFHLDDARLAAMHGYTPVRLAEYGRSIVVTREGLEALERQRQTTARARWKLRHRRDRITRGIWSA